jgi:hypothetical protein
MIHRTENISFPRSGHHLLVNLLQAYFGEEIRYCEYYSDYSRRMEVCEETNYQKNHDFELATPVLTDRKYVVQVRDPFEAITSFYELDCRQQKIGPEATKHEEWFSRRWDYYVAFVKKWVLADVPNRLVIHYRDLIDSPHSATARVIAHITDDPKIDSPRLEAAVRATRVVRYAGIRRDCIFSPKDVIY